MKLLKHIFSTYSAPSDCRQLEEDGTVDCIPSTVIFTYGNNNFNTAEELIEYLVNLICSSYGVGYVCYAQYETHPTYPPQGRTIWTSTTCDKFINYSPNQTQNSFNVVTTVFIVGEPYYLDKYSQRSITGYRIMTCPSNTTSIQTGGVTTGLKIENSILNQCECK